MAATWTWCWWSARRNSSNSHRLQEVAAQRGCAGLSGRGRRGDRSGLADGRAARRHHGRRLGARVARRWRCAERLHELGVVRERRDAPRLRENVDVPPAGCRAAPAHDRVVAEPAASRCVALLSRCRAPCIARARAGTGASRTLDFRSARCCGPAAASVPAMAARIAVAIQARVAQRLVARAVFDEPVRQPEIQQRDLHVPGVPGIR